MRILIHSDEYYPTAQACSYRMMILSDAFVELGYEVVVIASSANIGEENLTGRKENIYYSPAVKMKKKTTLWRMFNNISFGISSIFTSLKVGKIDLVITTSPPPLVSIPGFLISKIKKAKLIYDVRDIWPDVAIEMGSFSADSIYDRIFSFISSFMYKHSDLITTVSPGKVEKIKRHVYSVGKGKINTNKVILVSNGFDENVKNSLVDNSLIEKYNLNNKFTCVYIGNIGLAQGLDSLLDLAHKTKHKNVQFLLFGKGAEKEMLEKKARELELNNIHFCGILPHDKVFTLLSYAKISFIPLKNSKMKDSIPTKVYEALGIGCPVLLVAEGDSCDIVNESKMGITISPDNIDNLSVVFDEMVDNYSKYEKNKEYARELMANKYSRQKIANNFAKKINKFI